MAKTITTITQEQIDMFPVWRKKWIDIGLSTQPADYMKAKDAVLKIYDHCKLARPSKVIFASSPYDCVYQGTKAWAEMVYAEDKSKSVEQLIKDNIKPARYNYRGGAFWASWAAYVSFFRDVMGWENPTLEAFKLDETLTLTCGWVWWHEDVVVIGDRPKTIKLNEQGRLHCTDGPAVEYRDGWALYCWNGITVPEHVIMKPETITEEMIDAEANQEVRRVMIERFGYSNYVASAPIVHQDSIGKLRKRVNNKGDDIAVVEVINGSAEPDGTYRTYFLSVPPTINNATEAVAWTYGMTREQYRKLKQRT